MERAGQEAMIAHGVEPSWVEADYGILTSYSWACSGLCRNPAHHFPSALRFDGPSSLAPQLGRQSILLSPPRVVLEYQNCGCRLLPLKMDGQSAFPFCLCRRRKATFAQFPRVEDEA